MKSKLLNRIAVAVLVLLALVVVARLLVIKVLPGQTAVVNREYTSGFEEKDYGPGYHLALGPFHTWTVFDTTVQTLHMKRTPEPETRSQGSTNAVELKSSDGADVRLDVTIKFRIQPGQAHKVYQEIGLGQTFRSGYKKFVRDRADNVLRRALGSINTQQFYDPNRRQEVQDRMEKELRAALDELRVQLVAILIRDITFQAQFEEQIKNKALAEQEIELNIARTRAVEARGITQRIQSETLAEVQIIEQEREKDIATLRAENDRKVAAIQADFEKVVVETRSDADLYAARKNAEGSLLVAEAKAKGEALRRSAVAGTGGQTLVALEMAKNLTLGDITVSTQLVNPLDIQRMLELFGVGEGGGGR